MGKIVFACLFILSLSGCYYYEGDRHYEGNRLNEYKFATINYYVDSIVTSEPQETQSNKYFVWVTNSGYREDLNDFMKNLAKNVLISKQKEIVTELESADVVLKVYFDIDDEPVGFENLRKLWLTAVRAIDAKEYVSEISDKYQRYIQSYDIAEMTEDKFDELSKELWDKAQNNTELSETVLWSVRINSWGRTTDIRKIMPVLMFTANNYIERDSEYNRSHVISLSHSVYEKMFNLNLIKMHFADWRNIW